MARTRIFRCARKAGLMAAGVGSVAFAAALWWFLVPPEAFAHASTVAALALLGLFVLPAVTFATAACERKASLTNDATVDLRNGATARARRRRRVHSGTSVVNARTAPEGRASAIRGGQRRKLRASLAGDRLGAQRAQAQVEPRQRCEATTG